jgi:hypothetical protein
MKLVEADLLEEQQMVVQLLRQRQLQLQQQQQQHLQQQQQADQQQQQQQQQIQSNQQEQQEEEKGEQQQQPPQEEGEAGPSALAGSTPAEGITREPEQLQELLDMQRLQQQPQEGQQQEAGQQQQKWQQGGVRGLSGTLEPTASGVGTGATVEQLQQQQQREEAAGVGPGEEGGSGAYVTGQFFRPDAGSQLEAAAAGSRAAEPASSVSGDAGVGAEGAAYRVGDAGANQPQQDLGEAGGSMELPRPQEGVE